MASQTPNPSRHAPLTTRQIVAKARLGLLAVVAAFGGVATIGSSASAAKPQTLKLLEVITSFTGAGGFDATGNTAPAVGQGVVLKGRLYRLHGHKRGPRYGTGRVQCTLTNNTGTSVCTAVVSLPAGKLVVSGLTPSNPTQPYRLPILGGSRRYSTAKGHIRVTPTGNPNQATLTIATTG
jgi:hypothetical protein